MQTSMRLKHEPSSEPLHISVKESFLNWVLRVDSSAIYQVGGEKETTGYESFELAHGTRLIGVESSGLRVCTALATRATPLASDLLSSSLTSLLTSYDTREALSFLESDQY